MSVSVAAGIYVFPRSLQNLAGEGHLAGLPAVLLTECNA